MRPRTGVTLNRAYHAPPFKNAIARGIEGGLSSNCESIARILMGIGFAASNESGKMLRPRRLGILHECCIVLSVERCVLLSLQDWGGRGRHPSY
jgi:hypothetical protein